MHTWAGQDYFTKCCDQVVGSPLWYLGDPVLNRIYLLHWLSWLRFFCVFYPSQQINQWDILFIYAVTVTVDKAVVKRLINQWTLFCASHTITTHDTFKEKGRSLAAGYQRWRIILLGFEVLTAMVKKSSIFWDITPCNPLKVNRRFTCHLLSCWFLAWLILWPRRWRWYVHPNRRLTFSRLRGVISQVIFLVYFHFEMHRFSIVEWGWLLNNEFERCGGKWLWPNFVCLGIFLDVFEKHEILRQ
jgi:hypothetical protein